VNRALISSGERADVTFTLHNPGPSATMLPFTSSCHILPYIVNTSTGQIVHPSGGGWACLAVLTQLTVPPGDAVKENVQVVAAASAAYPAVALPPGTYSAYATVDSTAFQGRSDPIAFTVR
jgi:hypothetical protein